MSDFVLDAGVLPEPIFSLVKWPGNKVKVHEDNGVISLSPAPESEEIPFGSPGWVCPLDHTPNAETIAAMEEGEAILAGKIPCKSMTVDEFWKEMGF